MPETETVSSPLSRTNLKQKLNLTPDSSLPFQKACAKVIYKDPHARESGFHVAQTSRSQLLILWDSERVATMKPLLDLMHKKRQEGEIIPSYDCNLCWLVFKISPSCRYKFICSSRVRFTRICAHKYWSKIMTIFSYYRRAHYTLPIAQLQNLWAYGREPPISMSAAYNYMWYGNWEIDLHMDSKARKWKRPIVFNQEQIISKWVKTQE